MSTTPHPTAALHTRPWDPIPIQRSRFISFLCGSTDRVTFFIFSVNWMVFFTSLIMLTSVLQNYFLGLSGVVELIIAWFVFLCLFLSHRLHYLKSNTVINIYLILLFPILSISWFSSNGFYGSPPYFFAAVLIAIYILFKGLKRLLTSLALIVYFILLLTLEQLYPQWLTIYPSHFVELVDQFVSLTQVTALLVGFIYIFHHNLVYENARTDALLLNIFPAEIAHQLKLHPDKLIAHKFQSASVLFADIEGFTRMSEHLSAQEVAKMLNEIFSYLDTLVEKYSLVKIKTIGDCYMLAGGIPLVSRHHAIAATQLALEFLNSIKIHTFSGVKLSFRIGISTGPVLAGVVGQSKFIHDLWGDAVTHAQRMEQLCPANNIYVTDSTYQAIKNDFLCESAGVILIQDTTVPIWRVLLAKTHATTAPPNASYPQPSMS